MKNLFDYSQAFSRNLGWVTEEEQQRLRQTRVAIAGMGGVGGVHLLTLCRLGIGKFHIADLDVFELANFNRQAGANMTTLGRSKVEAMMENALNINPELDIVKFDQGVSRQNIDQFLEGVDIYVDGLDAFVLDVRREVFAACAKKGIPAITVAPVGMGAALLNFLPGKMSFEDYFGLEGRDPAEQFARFFLGLCPSRLQMKSLVDRSRVSASAQKAPSTPMGPELCAGVAATEVLKIRLKRGSVVSAPRGVHFDAYSNRLKRTWMPWGHKNPLFQAQLKVYLKLVSSGKI